MLKEINAAIANYERRINEAVSRAADPENMPGFGTIALLRKDMDALIMMRRDEEQSAEVARKIAAIDAA